MTSPAKDAGSNTSAEPGGDYYPRRYGPYVLLKPLARGGMGALYLALTGERGMEKLCVIKTALHHLADRSYMQRFRDEAKIVVRLSHGNLVTVFDAGQVSGEIFLAMDYIEGKDLRAVWNRCAQKGIAFPVDVAVHIAKELARGLGYAHSFGGLNLVHRDVSPPNLLLSYTGEVKLTDFGLATSSLKMEKTAPGVIYGKVSYMAPEQARGEPLDGRSDQYAAAIMLWELLTGRQLFPVSNGVAAKGEDDLLLRVRNPQPAPPSQKTRRVPQELDRIVLRALSAARDDRYKTCEEFRVDLAAFLAKTAPATDGEHVANFLKRLFEDDILSEREEREKLMIVGSTLLPSPGTVGMSSPSSSDLEAKTPALRKSGTRQMDPARAPPPMPNAAKGESTRPESGGPDGPARSGDTQAIATPPTADENSQVIGTILSERYSVLRLIGEGGMGRVYEAEHIGIGKRVAVKVLHPAYTRTPDVVERFKREARAASRIGHQNIVNVTDSGTTADGHFFFVMEFIEGQELGLVIHREGRFSFKRAFRIADQMCQALQAAHDAGIIHRDLKPENVLLITYEGRPDFVKVLDFGIAKTSEMEESTQTKEGRRLTRPGVAMGTPEYMAPEQAAGKPADPRSDIYAVGSILYEMLTGHPPYEGENVMEVLHKKATESPASLAEIRPDVPVLVTALVERAMARNADDRPQTMASFALEIALVLDAFIGRRTPTEVRFPPVPTPTGGESFVGAIEPQTAIVQQALSKKARWITVGSLLVVASLVGIRQFTHERPDPIAIRSVKPPPPASIPIVDVDPAPPLEPVVPAGEEGDAVTDPTSPEMALAEDEPEDAVDENVRRGKVSVKAGRKMLREAERMMQAQQYDKASTIFSRLTRVGPIRGQALVGLGQIAFQNENYDEAVKQARQGAKIGGGVSARVLLGDAYFRLGRFKDAQTAYTEALKLDPNNQVARRNLALAERRMP